MQKRPLIAGLIVFTSISLLASDLSGTWDAKVAVGSQNGTPTFILKQNGHKLTGTYSGAFGQAPVTGTVNGDKAVLNFESSGAKIQYSGKVATGGKKMEGTVDYGGQASGTFTAEKQPKKNKI